MPSRVPNLATSLTGAAFLLVVVGALWFGMGSSPPLPRTASAAPEVGITSVSMRIHVSGEVLAAGIVVLSGDAIVADAVAAAGGATGAADLSRLNLAAPVSDGELIVVPAVSMNGEAPGGVQDTGVDINASSAADLEALPGVGPVLAARIVSYRDQYGPFGEVEDLLSVPGIGEAKLAAMRDAISRP